MQTTETNTDGLNHEYQITVSATEISARIGGRLKELQRTAQINGFRPGKVLSLVVLPQALRVIIPPLTSQYLNLTKNSSLAIAIGYMDLVATLGGITLNQTGREMESMMLVMLVYLALSLLISAFMNWYNSRVRLVER